MKNARHTLVEKYEEVSGNKTTKSRLVIHMDDRSTDFLKAIYRGVTATVVTHSLPSSVINNLIDNHDQIIMLGHGCSKGLFNFYDHSIDGDSLIISNKNVEALRKKPNSIFIWCHASTFFREHDLYGFSTGMFVSEPGEAMYLGLNPNKEIIDNSNNLFAELVGKYLDEEPEQLYRKVYAHYNLPEEVVEYNRDLLTYR